MLRRRTAASRNFESLHLEFQSRRDFERDRQRAGVADEAPTGARSTWTLVKHDSGRIRLGWFVGYGVGAASPGLHRRSAGRGMAGLSGRGSLDDDPNRATTANVGRYRG